MILGLGKIEAFLSFLLTHRKKLDTSSTFKKHEVKIKKIVEATIYDSRSKKLTRGGEGPEVR